MLKEYKEILDKPITSAMSAKLLELTPVYDSTWQILIDCQITLPLPGLLELVPRFTEIVATIITKEVGTCCRQFYERRDRQSWMSRVPK